MSEKEQAALLDMVPEYKLGYVIACLQGITANAHGVSAFPLQADFGRTIYWIGGAGPFQYGEAVTAFFASELTAVGVGDSLLLMHQLEDYLQAFGESLQPYACDAFYDPSTRARVILYPEDRRAQCSVCCTYHPVEGDVVAMVERCTFQCLWDFLYVELCRAIRIGSTPRECRLCRRWFLHVRGEKFLYCENIAPGETEKTCRGAGVRASFEQKVRSDNVWKFYKRAYKKYYARVMKGNMTRDELLRCSPGGKGHSQGVSSRQSELRGLWGRRHGP